MLALVDMASTRCAWGKPRCCTPALLRLRVLRPSVERTRRGSGAARGPRMGSASRSRRSAQQRKKSGKSARQPAVVLPARAASAELHTTIIRITRPGRRAGCVRTAATCRTLWRMACPCIATYFVHPPPSFLIVDTLETFAVYGVKPTTVPACLPGCNAGGVWARCRWRGGRGPNSK